MSGAPLREGLGRGKPEPSEEPEDNDEDEDEDEDDEDKKAEEVAVALTPASAARASRRTRGRAVKGGLRPAPPPAPAAAAASTAEAEHAGWDTNSSDDDTALGDPKITQSLREAKYYEYDELMWPDIPARCNNAGTDLHAALRSLESKSIREAKLVLAVPDTDNELKTAQYLEVLTEIYRAELRRRNEGDRPIRMPSRRGGGGGGGKWLDVTDVEFSWRKRPRKKKSRLGVLIRCGAARTPVVLVKDMLKPKSPAHVSRRINFEPLGAVAGATHLFHADIWFALSDLRGYYYDPQPPLSLPLDKAQTMEGQIRFVHGLMGKMRWNFDFKRQYDFVAASHETVTLLIVGPRYNPKTPWMLQDNHAKSAAHKLMGKHMRRLFRAAHKAFHLPKIQMQSHEYGNNALMAFLVGGMPDDRKVGAEHLGAILFSQPVPERPPIVAAAAYCASNEIDTKSLYVGYASTYLALYQKTYPVKYEPIKQRLSRELQCTPMHLLIALLMRYGGAMGHEYLNLANAGGDRGFEAYTNAAFSNDAGVYAGSPMQGLLWPCKIYMKPEQRDVMMDFFFRMRHAQNPSWSVLKLPPKDIQNGPRSLTDVHLLSFASEEANMKRMCDNLLTGAVPVPPAFAAKGWSPKEMAWAISEAFHARRKATDKKDASAGEAWPTWDGTQLFQLPSGDVYQKVDLLFDEDTLLVSSSNGAEQCRVGECRRVRVVNGEFEVVD